MGYSYYWQRPDILDNKIFIVAMKCCQKVCNSLSVPLANIDGEKGPVFSNKIISFNGLNEFAEESENIDGNILGVGEPFVMPQVIERSEDFYMCKTNGLPYSYAVEVCLIVFKHYFNDVIRISCDGVKESWVNSIVICERELGYGSDFRMNEF